MKHDPDEEGLKHCNKIGRQLDRMEHLVEDSLKPHQLINEHLQKCGDDLILLTLKGHCR